MSRKEFEVEIHHTHKKWIQIWPFSPWFLFHHQFKDLHIILDCLSEEGCRVIHKMKIWEATSCTQSMYKSCLTQRGKKQASLSLNKNFFWQYSTCFSLTFHPPFTYRDKERKLFYLYFPRYFYLTKGACA